MTEIKPSQMAGGSNLSQMALMTQILTKTRKTPLIKSVAFGPTSCPFGLVPKSKLLHSPEAQYGFVPKHSLHGGKTSPFGLKNRI